jgi:membrane protein DedA with SNARE-associated domain
MAKIHQDPDKIWQKPVNILFSFVPFYNMLRIKVRIMSWESKYMLQNWIIGVMESYGYAGIALIIAIENLFPPIPSELILTFGGFMTTTTSLSVIGVIIASTLGSVLGAVILYLIGRLFNIDVLQKIIDRWGRFLRVKPEDLEKAFNWFNRYGYWTVFFCRMVPLIRSLISIPAGMAKLSFGLFLLFTIAGTLIWNTVLVSLGAMLGENWDKILHFMDVYSNITYAILAVLLIGFVLYWYLKKTRK